MRRRGHARLPEANVAVLVESAHRLVSQLVRMKLTLLHEASVTHKGSTLELGVGGFQVNRAYMRSYLIASRISFRL